MSKKDGQCANLSREKRVTCKNAQEKAIKMPDGGQDWETRRAGIESDCRRADKQRIK